MTTWTWILTTTRNISLWTNDKIPKQCTKGMPVSNGCDISNSIRQSMPQVIRWNKCTVYSRLTGVNLPSHCGALAVHKCPVPLGNTDSGIFPHHKFEETGLLWLGKSSMYWSTSRVHRCWSSTWSLVTCL